MQHPRPRPGARDRFFDASLGSDASESIPATPKLQGRPIGDRHRADFARDIVFAEFGYRQARAIDYDGFVDRKPTAARAWWRS